MDLADPSVDPVVLLERFVYWYWLRYSADPLVDDDRIYDIAMVCEWLWVVDNGGGYPSPSRHYYNLDVALGLVEV